MGKQTSVVFIWLTADGHYLTEAASLGGYAKLVKQLGRLPDRVECWRNLGGGRSQIGEFKRGPVNVIRRGQGAGV